MSATASHVAKKRRLTNKISWIDTEERTGGHNDAPHSSNSNSTSTLLLSTLLKISQDIKEQAEYSRKLESKVDEVCKTFKTLNNKIISISQIESLITRLNGNLQQLTKEISDLQIHALHGFASLDLNADTDQGAPYQHY
jgi:hypothetical protein